MRIGRRSLRLRFLPIGERFIHSIQLKDPHALQEHRG